MFITHALWRLRRCLLLLAVLAGLVLLVRAGSAQSKARVDVIPDGPGTILPGRWGALRVTFINLDDKPAELFAATYFDQDRSLQYGRKTWVPARSRLTLSHAIQVPLLEPGTKTIDIQTLLFDPKQESEVLLRGNQRDLQHSGRLRRGLEPATALMNLPDEFRQYGAGRDLPYELVVGAKSSQSLGKGMAQLIDSISPATPEAYACLDQIIVADNRLTHDGPAITAIRRWLFGGGHLWVMLDRVEPQLLELLLEDDFPCQVVDRVELTTVKITPNSHAVGGDVSVQEYEQPVDMVRAIVSGVEVHYSVDGWPAAFWKQCGAGKLLVTTLAPAGWMREGLANEDTVPAMGSLGRPGSGQLGGPTAPPPARPSVADPQEAALIDGAQSRAYYILPPLKDIATEFFSSRNPPAIDTKIFEPHVTEYVGSSVPSRWFITSMLGGFGAVLAGLGVVLWRSNRLEWLGAAGPALAVVVAGTLIFMGLTQRRSIPPTVATVQYVEALPGTNDILVTGQTDIYAPDAANTLIASQSGGWITPDRKGQEGQTSRMVWTDLDSWEWQHLPPNYNQRLGEFSTSTATAERIDALATFSKNGLTGRVNGKSIAHPADAVLATRDGRIGVDLNADGSFQARASQVFSGEQFIAAELLTDEQNRRSRTLAKIFTDTKRPNFPGEPKLLLWADPLDLGFQFDEGHRQSGAALIAIPLNLERPAEGTEVAIPSPFLPYRQVSGPDGTAAAGLYDHRDREWQQRARPSTAWLRFQIPGVLVPLELQRAKVTVQVTGPVGRLEIGGLRGKEAIAVKTWMDPVGTLSFEIDDPALLKVSEGGLLLRVSGGDPARPELTQSVDKANYWRIESLRLELYGKTSSPSANQP